MSRVIIFGTSEFSKLMRWYVEHDSGRMVVGFAANETHIKSSEFCGLPVFSFEKLSSYFQSDEFEVLVTAGYSDMNELRKRVFAECRARGYAIASFVHSTVINNADRVGIGNILLENVRLDPFCCLGDGNILMSDSKIGHEATIGNYNFISGDARTGGNVSIGDNCFIGMRSTIKDGISIGDKTLIGATTYVSKNSENDSVIISQDSRVLQAKSSLVMRAARIT